MPQSEEKENIEVGAQQGSRRAAIVSMIEIEITTPPSTAYGLQRKLLAAWTKPIQV
jgi:hypothetical protein